MSSWNTELPCEESSTITSTPSFTSAAARSRSAGRVPIAAAHSSCLLASLEAMG